MTAQDTCSACGSAPVSDGGLSNLCVPCAFSLALGSDVASTIGPYRLLRRIGEGGMGEVWEAEQTEPVRRRVALKLIKAGMDTERVIARFEAERQALAVMDHPSISTVLEAGSTEEGRPYFVMEYVDGLPITEHCDGQRATTRERLELFLQVCAAVQHAHQKAILHRDLKPSNVLVTLVDGAPVPKVIDFGVAKAIAAPLTERTVYTEVGTLIGTPEYMSPEQAALSGDVDTRTDVYALGVLLYELLVGALPFDPRALRDAGFDGLRRMIREVEPPRPSSRLRTLGDERAAEAGRHRRADVAALRRQLAGELDWITMKALEKDPGRRYTSPAELAADVRRHLHHEAVLAGPPSRVYRARKFVRRHRLGVGAAVVAVLALGGFAAAMAVQTARVTREAESRRRLAEFMTDLFAVSDPSQARGNSITARELLDRGVERIRTGLQDDPRTRADLMMTMGTVYRGLGLYAEAEPLLRDANDVRQSLLGAEDPDTLRAAAELGRTLSQLPREAEAEAVLVSTLAAMKRVLGADHVDTLRCASTLGFTLWNLQRYPEAEALMRETVAALKRVRGTDDEDTIRAMHGLAMATYALGRFTEAETIFLEEIAIARRVLGPDHRRSFAAMTQLALMYDWQGRSAESETLMREVLEISALVLGPRHPDVNAARINLGSWAAQRGDQAEALRHLRAAVEGGWADPKWIRELAAATSLHRSPEFEAIVAKAEENARQAL